MDMIKALFEKTYAKVIAIVVAVLLVAGIGVGAFFLFSPDEPANGDNQGKEDDKDKNDKNDKDDEDDEDDAEASYDYEIEYYVRDIEDTVITLLSEEAKKIPAGSYQPISGGVYIDGSSSPLSLPLSRVNAGDHVPGLTYVPGGNPANWAGHSLDNHAEVKKGLKVTIDGVFSNGAVSFKVKKITVVFDGKQWRQEGVDTSVKYDFEIEYDVRDIDDETVTLLSKVAEEKVPVGSYKPVSGGVYVNGTVTDLPLSRINAGAHLPGLTYVPAGDPSNWAGHSLHLKMNIEPGKMPNGAKVTIDGVFSDGKVTFKVKKLELVFKDKKWIPVGGVKEPASDFTIDYDVRDNVEDTVALLSKVAAEKLPEGTYRTIFGGVYVNGTITDLPLCRVNVGDHLPGMTYVPGGDASNWGGHSINRILGVEPGKIPNGTKVVVDGVFSDGTVTFKVKKISLVFKDGQWVKEGAQSGPNYDFDLHFDVADRDDVAIPLVSTVAAEKLKVGTRYNVVSGGVYIPSINQTVQLPLSRIEGGEALPGLTFVPGGDPGNWGGYSLNNHVKVETGVKVSIEGVYSDGTITFKVNKIDLVFTGKRWVKQGSADDPSNIETVEFEAWSNREENPDSTLRLYAPAIDDYANASYIAEMGGIYVNGAEEPTYMQISKSGNAEGLFYIFDKNPNLGFTFAGVEVVDGLRIKIDGVFKEANGVETRKFRINNLQLIYMNGEWCHYDDEWDVTSYADDNEYNSVELRFNAVTRTEFAAGTYMVPQTGGIYINGSEMATYVPLFHLQDGIYMFKAADVESFLINKGVRVEAGTMLKIDGIYTKADGGGYSVKFKATFRFDGTEWLTYDAGSDPIYVDTKFSSYDEVNTTTPTTSLKLISSATTGAMVAGELQTISGGIYVNGSKTPSTLKLTKGTDGLFYIFDTDLETLGFKVEEGLRIKIEGVFGDASYGIDVEKVVFEFDGAKWVASEDYDFAIEYEVHDINDETVALLSKVAEEKLPAGSYQPISGGVYANGTLTNLPISRVVAGNHLPGLTYIPGGDPSNWAGHSLNLHMNVAPGNMPNGAQVTIDGIFSNGQITFKVKKLELVFKDGKWIPVGGPKEPASDFVVDFDVRDNKENTVALLSQVTEEKLPVGTYRTIFGGVYVNGEISDLPLCRVNAGSHLPGLTYVPGGDPSNWGGHSIERVLGVAPGQTPEGTKVVIDGVFSNGTVTFKVTRISLVFVDGQWVKAAE